MIIVVASTKGGVGKSAFAMQAIAPYLADRHGSCSLYEIDDFNFDSDDYANSIIDCSSLRLNKGVERVVESLIEAASTKANIVIDVGGNKTCGEILEALGKSPLAKMINGYVIPISQTGKDVENAGKTIAMINKFMPDKTQKIFLGVTRIKDNYELEDVKYAMPDAIELAQEVGMNDVLLLPDNISIPGSRKLGMTVWELGTSADEHADNLTYRLMDEQAKEEVDLQVIREINRHVVCIEYSRHYLPKLETIFETLDRFYAPAVKPTAADETAPAQ